MFVGEQRSATASLSEARARMADERMCSVIPHRETSSMCRLQIRGSTTGPEGERRHEGTSAAGSPQVWVSAGTKRKPDVLPGPGAELVEQDVSKQLRVK